MIIAVLYASLFPPMQKSTVTIMNPTESTILLQLLPITAYKEPAAILDLFSDRSVYFFFVQSYS